MEKQINEKMTEIIYLYTRKFCGQSLEKTYIISEVNKRDLNFRKNRKN